MSAFTDLVCSECHEPFSIYRPNRDEIEEPICPRCTISTWKGINRFFCGIVGMKPKQESAKLDSPEVN